LVKYGPTVVRVAIYNLLKKIINIFAITHSKVTEAIS